MDCPKCGTPVALDSTAGFVFDLECPRCGVPLRFKAIVRTGQQWVGKCLDCGQPLQPRNGKHNAKRCDACRTKRGKEYAADSCKKWRGKLKDKGMCSRCGNHPSKPGKLLCEKCGERLRNWWRDTKQTERRCADCGVDISEMGGNAQRCPGCGKAHANKRFKEHLRQTTADRVSKGLCVLCGKESRAGRKSCQACKDSKDDMRKRKLENRIAAGLCGVCGGAKESSKKTCEKCLARLKANQERCNAKKTQSMP